MPNNSGKINKMLKNLIISDHGTCGCKKSKKKNVLEPKPRAKVTPKPTTTASFRQEYDGGCDDDDLTTSTTTTTSATATATTTLSFRSTSRNCFETHHDPSNKKNNSTTTTTTKMINPYPKLGDSLAVVKDSDDPYGDFRQSMLQMILERNIYSKDDLQELLNCFLQLNSSDHHQIIVRAFMEIWNGVAASKCSTAG